MTESNPSLINRRKHRDPLNDRHYAIVEFIREFKESNSGVSPTIREIGAAVGMNSTSMVAYYLDRLELEGIIKRLAVRNIQINSLVNQTEK